MQKPIWYSLIISLISVVFIGCENELDIAADWQELAIIYAGLDPKSDTQFVRIQRAYLDERLGALNFSSEPDSLYFSKLDVTLDEFHNGAYSRTIGLSKIDASLVGREKEEGVFTSDVNYLYYTEEEIKAPNAFNDYMYVITIKNPETGYNCTARTPAVGNAELSQPINDFIDELKIRNTEDHTIVAKYQEGKNARSYDLVMQIRVEEINRADTSKRTTKLLEWKMLSEKKTRSISGYNPAAFLVTSASFFSTIGAQLVPDQTIYRRLVDFDMHLYGISEEIYNYINVNKPSIGIVQKKPEYTNVTNGFGIFGSRHVNSFLNRKFAAETRQAVMQSERTEDLGFVSY